MADEIVIETTSTEVVEVGVPGPQGPAGAAGAGLTTLTTAGDLLYRDNTEPNRLPIGSNGQVLKVSGGLPAWANESGAVTSVNGATGAVTVAAATHAVTHEPGNEDPLQATAALVATDVVALNGVYFWDGTLGQGNRPNFYKTGTRKNTKLQYNSGNNQWQLVRNNVVEAVGVDGPNTVPWGNTWEDFVTPTTVSVTRLPLETMVQKLAETGSPAVATTSEDGLLSASDKTKLNNLGTASTKDVAASGNASNTQVVLGSDTRLSDSRTPTAHAASHASTGSDPLAPSDIGAQSLFTPRSQVVSTDVTLTSGRAIRLTLENYNGTTYNVTLPTTGNQTGDVFIIRTGTLVASQTIRRENFSGNFTTLATISSGQSYRFITTGTTSGSWQIDPVFTHAHDASDITSGTLDIARIPTGTSSTQVSLGDHVHGNLTSDGKLGSTAGLPVVTTTAGAVTTLALGTAGQVLTVNSGATGVEFAAASGVTGAASSASDVLGVSGANITGVDANADRIVYWNNTSNKLAYGTPADAGAAAASHTHTSADINSQTASNGHVLTANGSGGASFAALPASGGVSNVDSTLADVMSVSGSNLVADDGGLVDSSNPVLTWDDAAGKAVWANPLRRTAAGAFYVGVAPTTTALGTRAINIQADRSLAATRVATGTDSVLVGNNGEATAIQSTALGHRARATGNYSFCAGTESTASGLSSIVLGYAMSANATDSVSIGSYDSFSAATFGASAQNTLGVHEVANLRGQVSFRPFRSVYWGGQTTSDTANVELNLDATATNRMTIAANTAVIADIYVIARRTDNTKFLAARRWVAIRRDGSNNTALIGAVQTIGTDQSEGSPTWTFTIDADDTASVESLRVRVTGAAAETVNWRVCAIYRVVA